MRDAKDHRAAAGDRWLEHRVQFARGQWRREEQAGGVRSAGWWESVTVTWSPAGAPRRLSLVHRALATALDAIAPVVAELVAAKTQQLLDRRPARAVMPLSARRLPAAARAALPRPREDR